MSIDNVWSSNVLPDVTRLRALVTVAVLYPLVALAERSVTVALELPSLAWVDPAVLLTVPVVLAVGPAALLSVSVGTLVADLSVGGLGTHTLVSLAANLYLGYAAYALAVEGGGVDNVGDWTPRRYLLVVGVAGTGAAAVTAWMTAVLHSGVFFVAVVAALANFVGLNLVVTLPLTVGLSRVLPRSWDGREGAIQFADSGSSGPSSRPVGRAAATWVSVVTLSWVLVGAVGSVGYRTFEALPAATLETYGLGVLVPVQQAAPFGPGGDRLQVVFGAVMVVLLLALLAPRRTEVER